MLRRLDLIIFLSFPLLLSSPYFFLSPRLQFCFSPRSGRTTTLKVYVDHSVIEVKYDYRTITYITFDTGIVAAVV